jgi:hypothetical protein
MRYLNLCVALFIFCLPAAASEVGGGAGAESADKSWPTQRGWIKDGKHYSHKMADIINAGGKDTAIGIKVNKGGGEKSFFGNYCVGDVLTISTTIGDMNNQNSINFKSGNNGRVKCFIEWTDGEGREVVRKEEVRGGPC